MLLLTMKKFEEELGCDGHIGVWVLTMAKGDCVQHLQMPLSSVLTHNQHTEQLTCGAIYFPILFYPAVRQCQSKIQKLVKNQTLMHMGAYSLNPILCRDPTPLAAILPGTVHTALETWQLVNTKIIA